MNDSLKDRVLQYEKEGCLQAQFSRAAKQWPLRTAVVDGDGQRLTYAELDHWTDLLASYLRRQGLCEDRCGVIYMERSLAYVLAYIAILKAGGAYLPLDTSYPKHLIEDILLEAEPCVILTRNNLRHNIPEAFSNTIIGLQEPQGSGECDSDLKASEIQPKSRSSSNASRKRSLSNVDPDLSLNVDWKAWLSSLEAQNLDTSCMPVHTGMEALAFIVYSSGTTGKPKGIAVPQRAPVFSYFWRHCAYPYAEELPESGDSSQPEREACNVFFVWEMLRPLLRGQELHIIADDTIYDPPKLLQYLKERQITRMLFTPSLLETVLELHESDLLKEAFQNMREIWLCGEVVTVSLLKRCKQHLPETVQIINLYSISECHDVAAADLTEFCLTCKDVKTRKFCPVGKLLPGVQVLILGDNLEPQPVGVSGEIFVTGPTLARGYLKRPDLNEQKFLPIPEKAFQLLESSRGTKAEWPRMYRTGDWGYLLSDGSFEICGRCDTMVKIRGYSVEVQAVESMLLSLECVNACVVLALGEEGEDKKLVAYVVPSGETVTKRDIRELLKRRLPFYMIPNYYVLLKEIPILAASGKLDKKSLPPLDLDEHSIGAGFPPQTETERRLANLWQQVLQLKTVDIQESFFDIGGHSLLAAKLLNHINAEFQIDLPVKDLFRYPSISTMALLIEKRILGRLSSQESDELATVDLAEEVKLHDQPQSADLDIQLRAFWRFSRFNERRWQHACVMLTGATGFLGAYILRDLLLTTSCHVFCLVRDSDNDVDQQTDSKKRILQNLEQYELITSNSATVNPGSDEVQAADKQNQNQRILDAFKNRVGIVKGDIGLVHFGLSPEDYAYLCTEMDCVIHAAAYVNLVYPYSALYTPNVLGTANVLLFCAQHKVKPIHYISTDAVFPHGMRACREDADMALFARSLKDGYSQSKWVAEMLVQKAMQRGQPGIIYRFGNLSGDSILGSWNPSDLTFLMLRSMLSLGCGPSIPGWQMEMTPVDFASSLVVRLMLMVGQYAGKIVHVTQPQLLSFSTLYEWMALRGYQLEQIHFQEWLQKLEGSQVPHERKAHRLLMDLTDGDAQYFTNLSTFENHNLRAILHDLEWSYPTLDSSLLTVYFNSMLKHELIPPARMMKPTSSTGCGNKNLLVDRVVIVTGASSGIGQAVALHLASLGCLVSLAARRVSELERTRAAILSGGGRCICVPTDVTNETEVEQLIQKTEQALGHVDILVHAAGVMYYTLMKNYEVEQWKRTVQVNCMGTTYLMGGVLKKLRTRPGSRGHLVIISSDAGRAPFPGLAVYTASKYFVEGLCKATRKELATDADMKNVRITVIQPGDVRTPLQNMSTDKEAEMMYNCGMSGAYKMLEAEDISSAVVYALTQPEYVAVNEVLVEPREAPT